MQQTLRSHATPRGPKFGSEAAKQRAQRLPGDFCAHEGFADEEGINPVVTHQLDIAGRQDSAFGNHDAPLRYTTKKIKRDLQTHFKAAQITVIDADERRFELHGTLKLFGVVHFDQHRHAKAAGKRFEFPHRRQIKRCGDQQNGVGAHGAGFIELIRIDEKIFA